MKGRIQSGKDRDLSVLVGMVLFGLKRAQTSSMLSEYAYEGSELVMHGRVRSGKIQGWSSS